MRKKTFLLLVIIFLFSCITPCFADRSYYLKYPGVKVTIPDEYIVLTQDLSQYNPAWEKLGLTYDQVNPLMKSSHIYLNAIASKGSFSEATHEIIITVVESEFSKKVQNLGVYSGKDLERLCSSVADGLKESGITVDNYSITDPADSDGIAYFVFEISQDDSDQIIYGKMYSTVYNGKTINYTLWSYTGTRSAVVEFNLDHLVRNLEYDGSKAAVATANPTMTPAQTSTSSDVTSYLSSKLAYKALVAIVASLIFGVPALLIKSASKKKDVAQSDSPVKKQTDTSLPVINEKKDVPTGSLSENESAQTSLPSATEAKKVTSPKEPCFSLSLDKLPPKLHRAYLFLEDEEWERADQYLEAFLDEDPTNAYAYLGKVMTGLRIAQPAGLVSCAEAIRENKDFQKALRYAPKDLRSKLDSIL